MNNELQSQRRDKGEKLVDSDGIRMTLELGHATLAYAQTNRDIRLGKVRGPTCGLQHARKLSGGDERLFHVSYRKRRPSLAVIPLNEKYCLSR